MSRSKLLQAGAVMVIQEKRGSVRSRETLRAQNSSSTCGLPSVSAVMSTPPLYLTASTDVPVTMGACVCFVGPNMFAGRKSNFGGLVVGSVTASPPEHAIGGGVDFIRCRRGLRCHVPRILSKTFYIGVCCWRCAAWLDSVSVAGSASQVAPFQIVRASLCCSRAHPSSLVKIYVLSLHILYSLFVIGAQKGCHSSSVVQPPQNWK
jgi:hypothetical protein